MLLTFLDFLFFLLFCRFKDGQTAILDGDSYTINENGTLQINAAQPVNSGKYTCVATNNLGSKENHVFLEVKGRNQGSFIMLCLFSVLS